MRVRTKLLARLACAAATLALISTSAHAQTSAGVLTVTATVEDSILLSFESDRAGIALTGAGTNAATMAFGNVSAYGTIGTSGVTRTVTATDFTVSSPFGVKVLKANNASTDYTLAVALDTPDATNTWKVNAVTLTTSNQNLGTAYAYASQIAHTLYLTVPFTTSNLTNITQDINFLATSN